MPHAAHRKPPRHRLARRRGHRAALRPGRIARISALPVAMLVMAATVFMAQVPNAKPADTSANAVLASYGIVGAEWDATTDPGTQPVAGVHGTALGHRRWCLLLPQPGMWADGARCRARQAYRRGWLGYVSQQLAAAALRAGLGPVDLGAVVDPPLAVSGDVNAVPDPQSSDDPVVDGAEPDDQPTDTPIDGYTGPGVLSPSPTPEATPDPTPDPTPSLEPTPSPSSEQPSDPTPSATPSSASSAPSSPDSSSSAASGTGLLAGRTLVNAPAMWVSTSKSPTDDEIAFAATHYRVAIFNAWETEAAKKLHQLNPNVIVLAYQDLSSARSYVTDDSLSPTGVSYAQAEQHPGWFATDTGGNRIQWGGYGGHWQMSVWDPSYQDAWVSNVTSRIAASPFDGVLADNALDTLQWYFSGQLSGGKTDTDVRDGTLQLATKAAKALHAKGKLFIPNIADGRLNQDFWTQLVAASGGGEEEMFLHWSDDPNDGFVDDWADQGWDAQVSNIGQPGLMLVRTNAAADDDRAYRLGLASFWISGSAQRGVYTATTHDGYAGTPFRTEQAWNLGDPTGGIQRSGTIRYRSFTNGFAAANPSASTTQTIPVPAGMVDGDGKPVTSITLGPHAGALFRKA